MSSATSSYGANIAFMNIQIANNRIMGARVGEVGAQGGAGAGGGSAGQLAQLNSVDRYTFFPNYNNNVSTLNKTPGRRASWYNCASLHTGGAHVVLGDGTVRFLSENIDISTLTWLCRSGDNQTVGEF